MSYALACCIELVSTTQRGFSDWDTESVLLYNCMQVTIGWDGLMYLGVDPPPFRPHAAFHSKPPSAVAPASAAQDAAASSEPLQRPGSDISTASASGTADSEEAEAAAEELAPSTPPARPTAAPPVSSAFGQAPSNSRDMPTAMPPAEGADNSSQPAAAPAPKTQWPLLPGRQTIRSSDLLKPRNGVSLAGKRPPGPPPGPPPPLRRPHHVDGHQR